MTTLFAIVVLIGVIGTMLLISLGLATAAEFVLYRATGKRYIDLVNGKSRPGCGNTQDGKCENIQDQYSGREGKSQ